MSSSIIESQVYAAISGSGANVFKGKARLAGIFVSSASSVPTITVYDDPAAGTGTKIVDTFTPAAATWYQLPFVAGSGLNVVLGGTVSCTVAYSPGG